MKYFLVNIIILLSICNNLTSQTRLEVKGGPNKSGLFIGYLNGKYGIMDQDSNIIIPFTYDLISQSPAFDYEKDFNSFRLKDQAGDNLVTSDGKLVFNQAVDSITVIPFNYYVIHNNAEKRLYDDHCKPFLKKFLYLDWVRRSGWSQFILKKENKVGVLGDEGEVCIPFKYDSIISQYSYPYLAVKKDGKMGIFDVDSSAEIIAPQYDYIFQTHHNLNPSNIGNFIILEDSKLGLVDYKNNSIIDPIFDGITSWVEYGPKGHYVMKDGKLGLIDPNGKYICELKYDDIHWYSKSCIKVRINNKIGILNEQGAVILPIKFEDILVIDHYWELLEREELWVRKEDTWHRHDYKGKYLNEVLEHHEFCKKNHLDLNRQPEQSLEYPKDLMISAEMIESK